MNLRVNCESESSRPPRGSRGEGKPAAGICVARFQAALRWLSLGRWQNTRACRARAPCRPGCDLPVRLGRALQRREASLLRCKTVVRHASCDLHHAAGFRVTDARAPPRWLALGRWKNTRPCRARALCCADCDRPTQYHRAPHRRKTSLFPCKTAVRRASFGIQRAPGIRVARSQAPLRWLCLGRWRNTRACCALAPCLAATDPCAIKWHCNGGRPLSLGARPWRGVRAVTSNSAAGIRVARLQDLK